MKTEEVTVSLGELITAVYEEFLELYGDEELASVATAALINDMLSEDRSGQIGREEAA
ncbi:MAG: hypothetical protein AAFV53_25260 [Myxococcota bacterium]